MPTGKYERKAKKPIETGSKRKYRKQPKGFDGILAAMRAEKTLAEDRVVALGTAIDAMEDLEGRR